jgi:hypothetical protein
MANPQLPSPDEQRTMIQKLEQGSPLAAGEPAYLISSRWLAAWRMSVGNSTRGSVPEINNAYILSSNGEILPIAYEHWM